MERLELTELKVSTQSSLLLHPQAERDLQQQQEFQAVQVQVLLVAVVLSQVAQELQTKATQVVAITLMRHIHQAVVAVLEP